MDVGREVRWPLAPFIGTIVTAPERGVENSVTSQGEWGGNLDVRDVAAGNRILLNASHDGGLLFLGDVHGSQGDSELSGIADETAADVTLRCDVISDHQVPGVGRIEKPGSLVQLDCARRAGSPEAALQSCFTNLMTGPPSLSKGRASACGRVPDGDRTSAPLVSGGKTWARIT